MRSYARHAPSGEVAAPLWTALRCAAAPATIGELHRASNAHPNAIQHRLKRWTRAGFIDVLPAEPARYAIAAAAADRDEPPGPGDLSADAWRALRRLGAPATFEEILAASGAGDRALYCRLFRWRRSGYVVKSEARPARYLLSTAAPDAPEPPQVSPKGEVRERRRTARERLWATMRILKTFDVPVLMITAEAKRRSCEDFINFLARAGYVRTLNHPVTPSRTEPGKLVHARTWSTYQLVRNTGPKAPVISKPRGGERQLIDLNTGAAVSVEIGVRQRARG